MDTTIRTSLILLFLTLPAVLLADEGLPPLEAGEGYLVVGIDIHNIFWTSMEIDSEGRFGGGHRFTRRDLQTSLYYEVIKLPEGGYSWDRIGLLNHSYFKFENNQFPMTVTAGRLNYGGVFVGRGGANNRASFKLMNRASAAIAYLESCCAALLDQYTLHSGLTNADPFLEYYSSLRLEPEAPARAPVDDDAATEEPDGEIVSLVAEEFFRRNKISAPSLSPNGQLIVAFEEENDNRQIVLIDPVREHRYVVIAERPSGKSKSIDLLDVDWVDNDDLLISYEFLNTQRLAHATVLFEDGVTSDVKLKVLGDSWYVVDPLQEREDKAAIVVYNDGKPNLHIYDINESESQVLGTRNRKLQNKISSTYNWLLNRSGRVIAAVGVDEENLQKTLWYRTSKSNNWREAWVGDPQVTIFPVLASDDDRTLTVVTNEQAEHTVLTTYDRKTQSYGEVIFEVEGSDIETVMTNPAKTEIVLVTSTQDGVIRHHYIGDAKARYPQLLDFDTYGSEPYIIDQSNDGQRVVVQTSTSDDPGSYYLLDVDNQTAFKLGELRPWLSVFRLGSSQAMTTRAPDGLEIQFFLTLPDVESYPKPPLIVMPHGGPIYVQDRQHFNATVQMLSTLGYAVLQTNYRGSAGYGKSFEEQGERQWGRLIEDDIEASLDAVLQLNVVDPNKVCIYGASYGGYSALISAIRSPERYKCAASFAGVTDMALLFHAFSVNRSNLIRAAVERIVGDPDTELDSMIQYSPVFNADKIDIPVFIVHGKKDETVDLEHFERMEMTLKRFGKQAEFVTFDHEGHGLSYLNSAITFFTGLDRFFRRSMELPDASVEKILHGGANWPVLDTGETTDDPTVH